MRIAIIIGLLLVAAYLVFMPALARSQRRAVVVNVKSALLSSFSDSQRGNALTNSESVRYHVRPYSNSCTIGGAVYQGVLAADSWDYQGTTNLLVLTTDKGFLYIGQHGAIRVSSVPPGY